MEWEWLGLSRDPAIRLEINATSLTGDATTTPKSYYQMLVPPRDAAFLAVKNILAGRGINDESRETGTLHRTHVAGGGAGNRKPRRNMG